MYCCKLESELVDHLLLERFTSSDVDLAQQGVIIEVTSLNIFPLSMQRYIEQSPDVVHLN